jgi:hypothetical protein
MTQCSAQSQFTGDSDGRPLAANSEPVLTFVVGLKQNPTTFFGKHFL